MVSSFLKLQSAHIIKSYSNERCLRIHRTQAPAVLLVFRPVNAYTNPCHQPVIIHQVSASGAEFLFSRHLHLAPLLSEPVEDAAVGTCRSLCRHRRKNLVTLDAFSPDAYIQDNLPSHHSLKVRQNRGSCQPSPLPRGPGLVLYLRPEGFFGEG